jgi:hypothetical protein
LQRLHCVKIMASNSRNRQQEPRLFRGKSKCRGCSPEPLCMCHNVAL